MSNEVYLNPNFLLENISPVLDDEAFLVFLELYYDWMQTVEVEISTASGNFDIEEIVIGNTSGARGIIKLIKNGSLVLKTTSLKTFELKEILTGQTTGATASIVDIKDNVLKLSANLLRNKNPEFASGKYLEYLKSEFNNLYPTETEADRRLLISKLRNLYESKSTEEAYRFLFRSVFNENIEFRYPGEELLRVSDGKFEKTIVLRVESNGDIFSFLNETIRGASSGAVGNVVDIKVTFLGGIQYAEFVLSLVSGTFSEGEIIFAVNNTEVSNTTTYGMITSATINDGGSGYSVGDILTISGDGFEAVSSVSSISDAPINKLQVNNIGYGYRLGTVAAINNAGTGGSGLYIKVTEIANTYTIFQPVGPGFNQFTVGDITKVSILNRGADYSSIPTITLIDTAVKNLGALHENLISINNSGNNYSVGDQLVFSGGSPTTAANGIVASVGTDTPYGTDNILFEDSFVLVQETNINGKSSSIKDESWTNSGPILRIELYDTANTQSSFGFGYSTTNLSSVSISVTSGSGSNAQFTVNDIQGNSANVTVDAANNSVGIGSIRAVEISNFGIDYTNATIDASGSGDGNANISAVISGTGISSGRFINDDGKIDYRIIQDSLFYQDFSYVIKSALTLNRYDSIVKELVHPAGLEFFGEISIQSFIGTLPATISTLIDFPSAIINIVSLSIPNPIQSVYKRYRIWGTRDNPQGAEFRGNVVPIYIANSISEPSINQWVVQISPQEIDSKVIISPSRKFVEILELYADVSIQDIESIIRAFSELEIYVQPAIVTSNFVPKTIEIEITKQTSSIINDFSNYEIEIALEQNVSVNRVTELELDIDLPISVVSSEDRELQIEISPSVVSETLGLDVEYINHLEIYLDVSTTWYSEIQVMESATKIEIEVNLDSINLETIQSRELQIEIAPIFISETLGLDTEYVAKLQIQSSVIGQIETDEIVTTIQLESNLETIESRELQVKIIPDIVSETLGLDTEYVNRLELFIDLTTSWYSEIQVMESATKIEIDIILDVVDLRNVESRELQIEIAPIFISETLGLDTEYIAKIQILSSVIGQIETDEIVTTIQLESNLETFENRELQIEIAPSVVLETLGLDTEYVAKLQIQSSVIGQIETDEIVTTIQLESNLETIESRELQIEIAPIFISETLGLDTEYVNRLELYLDATTTWYSEIQVMESATKIEIEVNLDSINLETIESRELQVKIIPDIVSETLGLDTEYVAKLQILSSVTGQIETDETIAIIQLESNLETFENRELQIEIAPSVVLETLGLDTEYVNTIELFIDLTTFWYSEIQVMESATKIEIEVNLDSINLETIQFQKFKLEINLDLGSESTLTAEYVNKIPTDINLFSELNFVGINKIESEIISKTQVQNFDVLRRNVITYGDTTIQTLADRPIEDEENTTFESEFGQKSITKNIKISGFVEIVGTNVIGTGTDFISEYNTNGSLIVGNEKFIVTNISNTVFMTINVPPTNSYLGVDAYKEVSI
jgi:ribosome-binding protein aMBF1 (putative translation factor)